MRLAVRKGLNPLRTDRFLHWNLSCDSGYWTFRFFVVTSAYRRKSLQRQFATANVGGMPCMTVALDDRAMHTASLLQLLL